jgi:hypothetical protein
MNSPPLLKTALNYGALCAVSCFLVFLGMYWAGINPLGTMTTWLDSWIPVVFMILATLHYRNRENQGMITYWQAFRMGFLTASFGALLYGAMVWIFGTMGDGQFLDLIRQERLAAMELSEDMMKNFVGDSAFEQAVENITNMDMADVATEDILNKVFGGLLCAFITAAFTRREPRYTEE